MKGSRRYFRFNPDKALQVILLVASKVKKADFHKVSKVIYFADREHLEKYGRLICGDSYSAMKHGPVPSGVYDILKAVRGEGSCGAIEAKAKASFDVVNGYVVAPKVPVDPDFLSESDVECLDNAIRKYGRMGFKELERESHDKVWEDTGPNDLIDIGQIIGTLSNGKDLLKHLEFAEA